MDCQPHRLGDHGCLSSCAVRGAYSRFRASDTRVLRSRPPGNISWHWSAEVSAANSWDFRRKTDQWSGPTVNSGNVTLFGPVDLRQCEFSFYRSGGIWRDDIKCHASSGVEVSRRRM